jgi:hypothetical protein
MNGPANKPGVGGGGGVRQFLYLHSTVRKHLLCLIDKNQSRLKQMTDERLAAVIFAHRNVNVYA